MKTILIFSIYFLVLSQLSCTQTTQPDQSDFYVKIDVETEFFGDSVKIVLDKTTLLDSSITTNYSISLAWSSGLTRLPKNLHILHFEDITFDRQKDYDIGALYDTSTVTINFIKRGDTIYINQLKGLIYRR